METIVKYLMVWIHYSLINQAFISEHIGYFQFVAIMNEAAMSTVYMSPCAHIGEFHLYKWMYA